MPRRFPDWLKGLSQYVEETEAPRINWLWGGLFTIAATLQRRVWINYGLEKIYPNLYVISVAAPGDRKAAPLALSKKLLLAADVPVSVDSTSKRALTKELVEIHKTNIIIRNQTTVGMAAMAIISKEMSSLLAVDPKGLIEVLTDLYDSHDEWKYKTSGEGHDYLYNVCLCCYIATTPTWLMTNLPDEAIGGGFTSRNVVIYGGKRYKMVPFPAEPPENLFKDLVYDLGQIKRLNGEYIIQPDARRIFEQWYEKIPEFGQKIRDERINGYLNRMHVIGLKTAMALAAAHSDDLVISLEDMSRSLELVTNAAYMHSAALGGHGRSDIGPLVMTIANYVRVAKSTTFKELMSVFYRDLQSRSQLEEICGILETMKRIKRVVDPTKQDYIITFIKEEENA